MAWGAALTGRSEHSPREIAAREAFKVMTEENISRGHPCTYARGVLSFDLEALDRWYGVKARS